MPKDNARQLLQSAADITLWEKLKAKKEKGDIFTGEEAKEFQRLNSIVNGSFGKSEDLDNLLKG
jgi:hypothetical protein